MLAAAGLLCACNSSPLPSWPGASTPNAPAGPAVSHGTTTPSSPTSPTGDANARLPPLAAPLRARSWDEFKLLAARRIVAANQGGTYAGAVPDPLLAIPVLEIELNGNGSVRRILVSRVPRQAQDTVQLAIDAVQRAAPYGEVSHLPQPWKFTEVFLFDDNRRFKPRTLDI